MLITSMVVALGTSLDKVAVTASNPLFYSFVNTLGGAIVLTAIAWLTNPKFFQDVRVNARQLGLLGMFQGFGVTAYMLAIGTGLAAYVIAIKNANVVVGAVLGLVFLRESFSKQKVGSFGLIIIGLGLIAVG